MCAEDQRSMYLLHLHNYETAYEREVRWINQESLRVQKPLGFSLMGVPVRVISFTSWKEVQLPSLGNKLLFPHRCCYDPPRTTLQPSSVITYIVAGGFYRLEPRATQWSS